MRGDHLSLKERTEKALERIKDGGACMRIPVEATDPDVVIVALRDRVEVLEAALRDALQLAANAHYWLKNPRMGGEHVPRAIAELEKRMPLWGALEGE